MPGLSCGSQDLFRCGVRVGSSSLLRGRTRATCIGSHGVLTTGPPGKPLLGDPWLSTCGWGNVRLLVRKLSVAGRGLSAGALLSRQGAVIWKLLCFPPCAPSSPSPRSPNISVCSPLPLGSGRNFLLSGGSGWAVGSLSPCSDVSFFSILLFSACACPHP